MSNHGTPFLANVLGGPADTREGTAGKATGPKLQDSRVAEVRSNGPDYRGFIQKVIRFLFWRKWKKGHERVCD